VSGPTSVGKSTFIDHRQRVGSALPPVEFAFQRRGASTGDVTLHYNTLRLPDLPGMLGLWAKAWMNGSLPSGKLGGFALDGKWRSILASDPPSEAFVLVTSRYELLARISRRAFVEPLASSPAIQSERYDAHRWANILMSVDLARSYRLWIDELERRSVPMTILDSTSTLYLPIQRDEVATVVDKPIGGVTP
jgi:hypothetical protein